ncbi:Uncharacterised protein [Mycobacteroides abscessus subsp. abscessus]|nr:Uncharacterised protein [Mycobacteroides abscessus subsp. abscessus]
MLSVRRPEVRRRIDPVGIDQEFGVSGHLIGDLLSGKRRQIGMRPGVIAELDLPTVDERAQHWSVLCPSRVHAIDKVGQAHSGIAGQLCVGRDDVRIGAVIESQGKETLTVGARWQRGQGAASRQGNPWQTAVRRSRGGTGISGRRDILDERSPRRGGACQQRQEPTSVEHGDRVDPEPGDRAAPLPLPGYRFFRDQLCSALVRPARARDIRSRRTAATRTLAG